MQQDRPKNPREHSVDRMNKTKKLNLPSGYLEMRNKQKSSKDNSGLDHTIIYSVRLQTSKNRSQYLRKLKSSQCK